MCGSGVAKNKTHTEKWQRKPICAKRPCGPGVPVLLPAAGIPTFQYEIGIPRKTPFKGEL